MVAQTKVMKRKINSLYVHIPFCHSLCPYCDFTKLLLNRKFEDLYIEQLIKDLSFVKDEFFKFKTIYIGGGTPSCLRTDNLEKLLCILNNMRDDSAEFTIEANPEDINDQFLTTLIKYGVNRISIGIQTFDGKILDSIGRNYHLDFNKLISKTKLYISNINLDFIYGLPNYTKSILRNDLNTFFKLDVNHASFYSLIVSPGTIFYNKGIKEDDQDKSREYYDLILKKMRDNGFERYEVSNYSKPGYECKHNINYWRNGKYVAVGLGGSGYVGNERYTNTKNFSEYIKGINNKEIEKITNKSLEEYYLLTNLRLKVGFSLIEYKDLFKKDFLIVFDSHIKKLLEDRLVNIKDNRFYCTDEGLIVLDYVLEELFQNIN